MPSRIVLIFWWCLIALGIATPVACRLPGLGRSTAPIETLADRNVRFGYPAAASQDPNHREAYLIQRPEYTLSYNDTKKHANWVAWHLMASDIGDNARGHFQADDELPPGMTPVGPTHYQNSGFDRGHLCNSKDRTATVEANQATFRMTNIIPQAPANNQRAWESLERACRERALAGEELWIVAGPSGTGGEGDRGMREVLARGTIRVNVPAAVWKVILAIPPPVEPPNSPNWSQSRLWAVWMPNDQSVTQSWEIYQVPVRSVEARTGYRFFPKLPERVREQLSEVVTSR